MTTETPQNPGPSATEDPKKPSIVDRRRILSATALGATAVAASGMLAAGAAAAQTPKANRELSGKTAFVTGGARGIGLACGEAFAVAGANVALFDIATPRLPELDYRLSSEADLARAKQRIEAHGVRCLTFKGDVRDLDAQKKAMQQTVSQLGGLDIVVVNAGVAQAGAIEEFSSDELSIVLEVNVGGAIKTTQAAAPIMTSRGGGRIIFVSSALGRTANALFPIYGPSKWAMIGFAKAAALTYGPSNILCNVVAPGLVDTPFANNPAVLAKMMPGEASPTFKAVSDMVSGGNPLGVGHLEPEDVAKAVMLFAGDATEKVSGEVFDVSYGSLANTMA